jgi:TPR repeat protein
MIDWAWEARGSGYANTVSEEGWALFGRRLRRARADLERAATLDPTLAPAYARLITVGMGLSLEPAEGLVYFEKAVKADPTYIDAYTRQLTSMMPKWGGDEEAMWAFVKASQAAQPAEPALHVLTPEAHLERGRMAGDHRAYLRQADVRAALDAAHLEVTKAYPRAVNAWFTRQRVVSARKDHAQAREAVLMQAEGGSAPSQLEAAKCLYHGIGGYRRDEPKAVEFALRAAYHDLVDAMLLLALMLRNGVGVEQDLVASIGWLRGAARLGDENAMKLLGEQLGPEVRGEAIAWLRRASGSEDPEIARAVEARLRELEGEGEVEAR